MREWPVLSIGIIAAALCCLLTPIVLAFLGVAAVLLWLWLRGRRSGGAGEAVAPGRR